MQCNGSGRMGFLEKVGPEEYTILGYLDTPACGRCHPDEPVQDQQKCCHSIPRWQDEYESGSHIMY